MRQPRSAKEIYKQRILDEIDRRVTNATNRLQRHQDCLARSKKLDVEKIKMIQTGIIQERESAAELYDLRTWILLNL